MGLVCHVNLYVSIFSDDESLNDNFYKQLSLDQRGDRVWDRRNLSFLPHFSFILCYLFVYQNCKPIVSWDIKIIN